MAKIIREMKIKSRGLSSPNFKDDHKATLIMTVCCGGTRIGKWITGTEPSVQKEIPVFLFNSSLRKMPKKLFWERTVCSPSSEGTIAAFQNCL